MTRDELEAQLNTLAAQANADGGWNDGPWTQRIKEQLVRIAHGQDYMACAFGIPKNAPEECQPDWPEWLYDVTWLDGHYDGAAKRFTIYRVPVIAEIEWGNGGDVWDDFQKLPIARAGLRIMIFNEHPDMGADNLVWQIEHFAGTSKGDRYLLASYSSQTRRFNVVEHEATGLPLF